MTSPARPSRLGTHAVAIGTFAWMCFASITTASPAKQKPTVSAIRTPSEVPSSRADGSADCVYTPLTSGVTTTISPASLFAFTMSTNYWCAVGVRPQPADDWDIRVYQSTAPFPTCTSALLASSTEGTGTLDFIVGDFNYNPQGEYYPSVVPFGMTSGQGTVEWDDDPDALTINGYGTSISTGPNDVLECWDVYLSSGVQYTISLGQTGATQAELFLFRNPTGTPSWQTRSTAVVALPGTSNGATAYYTPLVTGWYGVVVTNENGGVGTFALRIDTCEPPAVLTSGTTVLANRAPSPYQYTQAVHYWSAAAVRPTAPNQDWDLVLYRNQAGGPFPGCFSNLIETSTLNTDEVDLVVGDFNFNPLTTIYVDAIPTGLTSTDALVEWEGGGSLIGVNDPVLTRPVGANDLVSIWDVLLQSGQHYRLEFSAHSINGGQAPNCMLLLFRNANPGFSYWSNRQFADIQTKSSTVYTAPTSDYYALAVVNDGGAGEFTIGVFDEVVGVPSPPRATVNRLSAVVPNPARGSARFEFELAREATVEFEIVDLAGRMAARLPAEHRPAGPSSVAWNRQPGTGSARGVALGSGVYFVRMLVDGMAVGTRRLVVLD